MITLTATDRALRARFCAKTALAHPAKLHLGLLLWLVDTYTTPGQTILDLMELEAVAQGLAAIRRRAAVVTVRTDSQCVIGWLTGAYRPRQPHIEAAVTRILAIIATQELRVTYTHVRGHTGDPDNERCDQLAGSARKAMIDN